MLSVEGLTKAFGSGSNKLQVLKGVDMNIKQGEMVALMGPSGSGKSTLLNIIGGFRGWLYKIHLLYCNLFQLFFLTIWNFKLSTKLWCVIWGQLVLFFLSFINVIFFFSLEWIRILLVQLSILELPSLFLSLKVRSMFLASNYQVSS